MMQNNSESLAADQHEIHCQISGCQNGNQQQFNDKRYCTDCELLVCRLCASTHDENHTLIENADFTSLPLKSTKIITDQLPGMGNISPILQNGRLNNSNDSKMISEDTLPDTEEKKIPDTKILDNINKLHYLDEDSDEDEDDDNNFADLLKVRAINVGAQINTKAIDNSNVDEDDNDDDDDDDDDDDMISYAASKMTGKTPISPSTTVIDDNMYAVSKSSFDSRAIYFNDQKSSNNIASSNFSKPQIPQMNGNNFLQVPSKQLDFSNVKSRINESPYQNGNGNGYNIINGNSNIFSGFPQFENPATQYAHQHSLTEVQRLLQSKVEYKHLLGQFYQDNPPPKNKISKKVAKILGKKKRKAKDELGGLENDDSMMVDEDVPIPELAENQKEKLLNNYDAKSLTELKTRSKRILDEIKIESDALFKDIKPHIHGVQYSKDEMDRINKYKKYAVEGIESYFLYLKDQFTLEYDKLKKCKKRDKLSKMMNKILDLQDKFAHYKEAKDYINFMNKDYKYYLVQIRNQLNDVQKEGNDFPPNFKIVYENLYDIFFSLISYISLNLPNQKNYSQFSQPIISIQSSKSFIIPSHYPSKKVIGLYDCRTAEIEEILYDYTYIPEFQKYRNYQIVNDNDFIYFIGGSSFNEEKNTFNPTNKSFKMSRHSGEITQIRDMPYPKMKFGISILNNSIFIFGGLQTSEKHRSNSCEKYDITTNTWKILPTMSKNRVCPLVSPFITQGSNSKQYIYLIGGMEDKNNINYSIEVFDSKLDIWIDYIERPLNSKCYIPKQLGYALQINNEQILIIGGLQGRKQKPSCSMQVYNITKKSICNLSLDSLPTGILKDSYCGMPVIHNKSIMILNTQISQYFPNLKQLEGVTNIIKIGLNQQEIIATHCF